MSHAQLVFELTILVLAIFLGFEVISKVPTLLHTPLMSGTNAIHGIVIVGAMLVLGAGHKDTLTLGDRVRRRGARLGQRRRRLRRHRPHARDVQAARAADEDETDAAAVSRTTPEPALPGHDRELHPGAAVPLVARRRRGAGTGSARWDADRDRRHLRPRLVTSYWEIVARHARSAAASEPSRRAA